MRKHFHKKRRDFETEKALGNNLNLDYREIDENEENDEPTDHEEIAEENLFLQVYDWILIDPDNFVLRIWD